VFFKLIKVYLLVSELYIKYTLFFSYYKWTWIFPTDFSKYTRISNFTKIRPVGSELSHADRHTDRWRDRHDEANIRFSQFCLCD